MKALGALLGVVVAVMLGRIGVVLAAFGEADDAPPAVLLGWAIVIGAVALGVGSVVLGMRTVLRRQ
jgi:hypothetical protein